MRALLFPLAASVLALAPQDVPAPHWHSDLETARREARQKNRPLLVVFRCER